MLDGEGRTICCELWPGNTTDVTTLIQIIDRLKERFGIKKVRGVADRGMISKTTIASLESATPPIQYILGVRMRNLKEARLEVLGDEGEYQEVCGRRKRKKDPSPPQVKEVVVDGRRYIQCFNPEQAEKDAADRNAILEGLEKQLKQGDKSLVGNKGFRRYLKSGDQESIFTIDEMKAKEEAQFDEIWILRTNTELTAPEVALKYKQLWMVEEVFRSTKSILATRPIYHKCDVTIRGHVFCSFLGLVLKKELYSRLEAKRLKLEWKDILRDLKSLREVEVESQSQVFYLRTDLKGHCHETLQAARVRIPPTVRQ